MANEVYMFDMGSPVAMSVRSKTVHLTPKQHWLDPANSDGAWRGDGMGLDPVTREQLIKAREVLLVELDEVECRAETPFRSSPEYRDVFAKLQSELR